ncbi:paeninodin family lasso peptide [Lentibacillus sp. Marseille-P4043]|nr:paeninodin family lasso peptide [Lentibacillus sp. Marseille-P4043]
MNKKVWEKPVIDVLDVNLTMKNHDDKPEDPGNGEDSGGDPGGLDS